MVVEVALERVLDPIGQPQQRQLTKRTEIADAKVVRQRRVDLVGGVDVAVRHSTSKGFGRHVDDLDLLGASHDGVGNGLLLVDSRDLLDHVVDRLQVLDVDGGDHVDARVEQRVNVLPALFVRAAR